MAVNTYSGVAVVVAVVVALLNKGFKWEKNRRKRRTWVSKFRLTAVGVGAGLDLW